MGAGEIVVATHGHCFDGLVSAALFTRLRRALGEAPRRFRYLSLGYGPRFQMAPEAWLSGVENAILDFRYTPSKRTTWFFDHHKTGFGSEAERDLALAEGGGRVHYDAAYTSCAKLIRDVAERTFDVSMSDLDELVAWADRIDSARFASAEEAVRREAAALRIASVVEHHGDAPFLEAMVPRLLGETLDELAGSPFVVERLTPILAEQEKVLGRVERAGRMQGSVVVVDLTEAPLEVPAKFAAYALFPDATYSATLTRSRSHYKLSIGFNPWSGRERTHDIATLCARFGGGGHPAVGACSFPLDAADRARAALTEVARTLEAP